MKAWPWVVLLLIAVSLEAQSPPAVVRQDSLKLDAALQISTSATSAATLTLVPEPGQSVYVFVIDVQNCAGASAVTAAAPTTVTTTNLRGAPAWTLGSGVTAGLCTQSFAVPFPTGLKAEAPSLPVTVVLPAFATNQTVRVNVAWRSAP